MDQPNDAMPVSAGTAMPHFDGGYVAFHAPRFAYLLRIMERIGVKAGMRVLDIGRSPLTDLIRKRFGVRVDSLGFDPDTIGHSESQYQFDLNWSQDPDRWRRDLPAYDVIVMAEVIEHLHTAPQLVLGFLKTLLVPNGFLLLQTPNAAAGTKRVKLLLGRNPYEMIRLDATNPGHFREYTVSELHRIADGAGFDVTLCERRFYFDARYAHHGDNGRYQPLFGTLKNALYSILPSFLRPGITMVLRRR